MFSESEQRQRHHQFWQALETLAARYQLSLPKLAKLAGLDPSALSASKRISQNGHLRWTSTETIDRILLTLGSNWLELANLMDGASTPIIAPPSLTPAPNEDMASPAPLSAQIPLLTLSEACQPDVFSPRGLPIKNLWRSHPVSIASTPSQFLIEIDQDFDSPWLRQGYRLLIDGEASLQGQQLILISLRKSEESPLLICWLRRQTLYRLETSSIHDNSNQEWAKSDLNWLSRIVAVWF